MNRRPFGGMLVRSRAERAAGDKNNVRCACGYRKVDAAVCRSVDNCHDTLPAETPGHYAGVTTRQVTKSFPGSNADVFAPAKRRLTTKMMIATKETRYRLRTCWCEILENYSKLLFQYK